MQIMAKADGADGHYVSGGERNESERKSGIQIRRGAAEKRSEFTIIEKADCPDDREKTSEISDKNKKEKTHYIGEDLSGVTFGRLSGERVEPFKGQLDDRLEKSWNDSDVVAKVQHDTY